MDVGVHMARFEGQVAVVTGAGGGLGRAHALALAAEGARVVVNDYGGDSHGTPGTSAMADEVVGTIRAAGGEAVADAHDVATDGAAVVQTALDAFGGIHALVNNAGIAGGGEFDTIEPAAYDRMLAIHLGGTLAVTRAAWPIMREQGYGRIVNTSSASVYGLPGSSHYITAKAALFGLTRALSHDGRKAGIKVNAIMPSAYSRLTAQSKEFAALMEAGFPPDSVAPFVAALASRDVPVSGETFIVGGGRAARVILGTVPGLVGIQSVDDALARFDEAMNSDEIIVPPNAMASVIEECVRLGIDHAAFLPMHA
jgi:NAD(P)-dependent dehydrogenase (short-subunit alcohol dehydrogenase family)